MSLVGLFVMGCMVACGPTVSTGGTGGAGAGSGSGSSGTGGIQWCTVGTECPTQCCWANLCAGEEDKNICADHNVTPDQCGKCVSG